MSADTVIQWARDTVNFWWGCTKVSRGCQHCYAEAMARRLGGGRVTWGESGARWLRVAEAVSALLKLERLAQKHGETRRVFINSMSDTFEDRRDLDDARSVLFGMPACTPQLYYLLLTKRPENVRRLVPAAWLSGAWPRNVWLGTTVENQAAAEARVPHLLDAPAPLRFLSCEPLVGAVDLVRIGGPCDGLDALRGYAFCDGRNEPAATGRVHWVIAGGESGQRAAPCDLDWIRGLRQQCAAAQVPFFAKQLGRRPVDMRPMPGAATHEIVKLALQDGHGGNPAEWPEDLRIRELPEPVL